MTVDEHNSDTRPDRPVRPGIRATATRAMPAGADAVLEVITSLDDLSTWLPDGIDVDLYGPGLLRLWIRHGVVDRIVERQVHTDWDLRRITWGEPGSSYSGTAQVLHVAPGRSAVIAQVELRDTAHRATVEAWLDRALDGLAEVVAAESEAARWWSGTVLT
ncbi:SRPBCC family protein [Actinosynnema sp. CA-248983]